VKGDGKGTHCPGYNWITLSLRVINTETWASRMGRLDVRLTTLKNLLFRNEKKWKLDAIWKTLLRKAVAREGIICQWRWRCWWWCRPISWSRVLEKLLVAQPLNNIRAFYGARRVITVFKRALHWSVSRARSIQSVPPHPILLRSILKLPSHLCLGLSGGLFLLGFMSIILWNIMPYSPT
jgi:hypothetical protein